jgi:hypothetical protein
LQPVGKEKGEEVKMMQKGAVAVYNPSNPIEAAFQNAYHEVSGRWMTHEELRAVGRSLPFYRGLTLKAAQAPERVASFLFKPNESGHWYYPCDIVELRTILSEQQLAWHAPILLFSPEAARRLMPEYPLCLVFDRNVEKMGRKFGGVLLRDSNLLHLSDFLKRIMVRDYLGERQSETVYKIIKESMGFVPTYLMTDLPFIAEQQKVAAKADRPRGYTDIGHSRSARKRASTFDAQHVFNHFVKLHGSYYDDERDAILAHPVWRLEEVPLSEIRFDDDEVRSPEEGKLYAFKPTPFPPIVLRADRSVLDGMHRVWAARYRDDRTISAYVPVAAPKTAANVRGRPTSYYDNTHTEKDELFYFGDHGFIPWQGERNHLSFKAAESFAAGRINHEKKYISVRAANFLPSGMGARVSDEQKQQLAAELASLYPDYTVAWWGDGPHGSEKLYSPSMRKGKTAPKPKSKRGGVMAKAFNLSQSKAAEGPNETFGKEFLIGRLPPDMSPKGQQDREEMQFVERETPEEAARFEKGNP